MGELLAICKMVVEGCDVMKSGHLVGLGTRGLECVCVCCAQVECA